jgi:CHRD domain
VKITLLGLAPSSKHPAHIHAGSCTKAGNVLYPLQDVVADETGSATSTSTTNNVTSGIPATGWYINVHNGPGLSPGVQFSPISCGNIANSNTATTGTQKVQTVLSASTSPSQAAIGNAQLSLSGGKLTVTLALQGLQPKSTHAAHVHSGSCGDQGKVLYDLKPIVADASGKGSTTTTISGVSSVPDVGWYINVHLTTDMTTQTSDDPIACGDVLPIH